MASEVSRGVGRESSYLWGNGVLEWEGQVEA